MTGPLRLTTDAAQRTPHEMFRMARAGAEYVPQACVRGDWRSLYSFDLQRRLPDKIEVLNFFVAEHPDSPFKSRLMAARRDGSRTLKLRDAEVTIQHRDGAREPRVLRRRARAARCARRAVPDRRAHGRGARCGAPQG